MLQRPNTPTVLSPGLQALITLKQTASPMTQGPGGQPMPTVAGQAMQQVAQQMQPQQPQGIAGLPQAAQMAGQAASSVQQQQQGMQDTATAQRVAALMQQQAQQAQSQGQGGVAGLPADNMRGFKEGGIIGFNGDAVSQVPDPNDGMSAWDMLKKFASPDITHVRGGGYRYMGQRYETKEAAEAAAQNAPNGSDAKFSRPQGAGQAGINSAPQQSGITQSVPTATAPRSSGIAAPPADGTPESDALRAYFAKFPNAADRARAMGVVAARTPATNDAPGDQTALGITVPSTPFDAAVAGKTGIAAVLPPAAAANAPMGRYTEQDAADAKETYEESKRLRKSRPDTEGDQIAALQQHRAEMAAQTEQMRKQDQHDLQRAAWQALSYPGQDIVGDKKRAIAQREAQYSQAKVYSTALEANLVAQRHAQLIDDQEKLKKLKENEIAIKQAWAKENAPVVSSAATNASNERVGAAKNASDERIGRAHDAANVAINAGKNDVAIAGQIRQARADVEKALIGSANLALSKDPARRKQYDDMVQKKMIAELLMYPEALEAYKKSQGIVEGGISYGTPPSGAVKVKGT